MTMTANNIATIAHLIQLAQSLGLNADFDDFGQIVIYTCCTVDSDERVIEWTPPTTIDSLEGE